MKPSSLDLRLPVSILDNLIQRLPLAEVAAIAASLLANLEDAVWEESEGDPSFHPTVAPMSLRTGGAT
jgi:hypothetical protein